MYLRCIECGKKVSNKVPDDIVFRAIAICPECIQKGDSQETRLPTLDEAEKRIQAAVVYCKECDEPNPEYFLECAACGSPLS